MGFKQMVLYLAIGVLLLILQLLYSLSKEPVIQTFLPQPIGPSYVTTISHDDFLVKSKTCSIPMMYAFDPTVKRFISISKYAKCKKYNFIAYKQDYVIYINTTVVRDYYKSTFRNCRYLPFIKSLSSDRSVIFLKKNSQNFTKFVKVKDAFVKVDCFIKNNTRVESHVFAFIIRNKTLDNIMQKRLTNKGGKRPMNILYLLLESTSRLNFIRHMNYTYEYLIKTLKAVEMVGYNKIGLNTFPNVLAMLTGVPRANLIHPRGPFDDEPFIFKNLSRAGYRTYMNEDYCGAGTFQYLTKGFYRAPVDHYMRPYMLRKESEYRNGLCVGNKMVSEVLLEDLMSFVRVYNDVPHFAYSMISRQSHDNPNGIGPADIPYFNMLKALNKKNYLSNTVVIVVGDHGSRYGSLRNTFQGRLEEHLPALLIAFPTWFRNKHAELMGNLKTNAHKLISNYDIYATFLDIIAIGRGNLYYKHDSKYGKSLLRYIPNNRTCNSTHIPPRYCACSQYKQMDTKTPFLRNISKFIVSKVNGILSNVSTKCYILKLDSILLAQKSVVATHFIHENHTKIVDYVVNIKVSPSNAFLEGAVRYNYDIKEMKLLGDVSRTNKYAGQSDCVHQEKQAKILERYCFCKNKHSSV